MAIKTYGKIQCEDCGQWIAPRLWLKHYHDMLDPTSWVQFK